MCFSAMAMNAPRRRRECAAPRGDEGEVFLEDRGERRPVQTGWVAPPLRVGQHRSTDRQTLVVDRELDESRLELRSTAAAGSSA